jgi:hypothetical protein
LEQEIKTEGVILKDQKKLGHNLWLILVDSRSTLEERFAVVTLLDEKNGFPTELREDFMGVVAAEEFRATKKILKEYIGSKN